MDRDKESRTRENGLHLWYLVRFDASQSLEEVAGRLSRLGELSKVQYNGTLKKYSAKSYAAEPALVPGAPERAGLPFNADPGLSRQWHYMNSGSNSLNESRAMKYAADNGAVILQCSWGYTSALADPTMYSSIGPRTDEAYLEGASLQAEAFDYFIYNAGSKDGIIDGGLVIFASGNEYAAMPSYPGAFSLR